MKKIIIAFSGGIDSSCALYLHLRKIKNLILVHINYKLHIYSTFYKKHCKNISTKLKKTFFSYTNKKKNNYNIRNIQAWARKKRYKFFYALTKKLKITFICFAHQKNDIIENYLLNSMKGNFIELKTLVNQKNIKNKIILKPLIYTPKINLKKYCLKYKIIWLNDHTNDLILYQRNKIRNKILLVVNNNFQNYKTNILRICNKYTFLQIKLKLLCYLLILLKYILKKYKILIKK